MEVLLLDTRWRAQAHRFELGDDGLVDYRDVRVTPLECYTRFIIDYPMFEVVRATVCIRENIDGPKPYRWVELKRFA